MDFARGRETLISETILIVAAIAFGLGFLLGRVTATGDSLPKQPFGTQIGSGHDVSHTALPSVNPDAISEVKDLVRRGKKLEAIKRYRAISGLGLKEAKEQIEKLERE